MGNQVAKSEGIFALPNSAKEGYSSIYRCASVGAGPLISRYDENVTTLYENMKHAAEKYPKKNALGHRNIETEGEKGPYHWQTYETVWKRIHNFASGLINVGIKQGDHIGIFSRNRPEWVIAEQACYSQSAVVVALYDTLGPDSVAYILNHANISTVICTQDKIKKLIEISTQCPQLRTLVQIEYEGNKELLDLAESKGIKLYSFAELEDSGALRSVPSAPPSPVTLSTIMYTSGTTGVPKGVLLTHENVVSAIASAVSLVKGVLRSDDIEISFLPMAHIFERVVQGILIAHGASIGFFRGDVQKLFDDIAVLKPSVLPGVPRLFSRVFDKIMLSKDSKGGIAKFLFDIGYSSKQSVLESGQSANDSLWNSIVFDKIRERFGGRIRLIITGAAPITKEVFQFLQISFSCPVLQGYGLTETCAATTITRTDNVTPGHTGPPVPCVEIRLADVVDMKYLSTDTPCPRGEICVRGPPIFKGYYQAPDQTKECMDDDGFFHTGDIGRINEDGTVSIIDRKKNIFKLAQGEYVAAEYLEGVLQKNKWIMQMFMYGDSTQICLVAIIVPDPEVLIPYAKEKGLPNADNMQELCKQDAVRDMIFKDIVQTGRESKLLGFEIPKAIYLEANPFTIENDLLTPTFKLKRPQLKDAYKDIIAQLYASIPPAPQN